MERATADEPRVTRRQLLGTAAAVSLGSTGGCVQRIRSIANRNSPVPVSVTVTAPPADSDRMATLIARHIVENFEAVGINATLNILPETELYREVFLNRNFELFVAPMPPMDDPNSLTSLVHSVFATEAGEQNPYNFTDITVDNYLESQRRSEGSTRRLSVTTLLRRLIRDQPFTTVVFPDEIRAVRTDRFTGWEKHMLRDPVSYLALEPEINDPDENVVLSLSITDGRFSENLNPLAFEYRQPQPFTSLLYDPLIRQIGGETLPWLAAEWDWLPNAEPGDDGAFLISLQPDLQWHDGQALTADDVTFTYQFLQDTSLDTLSRTVPAPRFRSVSSFIKEVIALDEETVRIATEATSEEVATQLLSVPILPEHIWREKRNIANIQGIEGSQNVTEALVWANEEGIGSGPLAVEEVTADEAVVLRPFEDHFLWNQTEPSGVSRFPADPPFDELELRVVPSDETAVELVTRGDLDGTASSLNPHPTILERMATTTEISRVIEESNSPYQVGYNTGNIPFSNPHFRRLLGRLVDKQYIASSIFNGYGRPAANPFDGTRWSSAELDFGTEDPAVPFLGTDGKVDIETARTVFREQGFEFDGNGRLILR